MLQKRRLPEERTGSEQQFTTMVFDVLSEQFDIERQVRGKHCSGRTHIIDAVMRPKDSSGWKDDIPVFGVEIKNPFQGFDTKDFTSWAAQAVDYTHVDWEGYGRLRIFTCPSLAHRMAAMEHLSGGTFLMVHLLGKLGVGELCRVQDRGWSLLVQDHVLWSQAKGVEEAKRWSIKPRTGSSR